MLPLCECLLRTITVALPALGDRIRISQRSLVGPAQAGRQLAQSGPGLDIVLADNGADQHPEPELVQRSSRCVVHQSVGEAVQQQ